MPLVIDTYNVLHTVGVLPAELAGLDVAGLARLIHTSRYRDEKTTLVCDGLPDDPHPNLEPPVIVRYAGRNRTADDMIAQIVRASSSPRRLIVVSSDHAVQRSARKRRCKILTSQEFLQQLADDATAAGVTPRTGAPDRKPQAMSQDQVGRWVKIFNIDERTAAIQTRGKSSRQTASNDPNAVEPDAQENQSSGTQTPAVARQIPELAPGGEVPDRLIEQAERLWAESNDTHPSDNNRPSGSRDGS